MIKLLAILLTAALLLCACSAPSQPEVSATDPSASAAAAQPTPTAPPKVIQAGFADYQTFFSLEEKLAAKCSGVVVGKIIKTTPMGTNLNTGEVSVGEIKKDHGLVIYTEVLFEITEVIYNDDTAVNFQVGQQIKTAHLGAQTGDVIEQVDKIPMMHEGKTHIFFLRAVENSEQTSTYPLISPEDSSYMILEDGSLYSHLSHTMEYFKEEGINTLDGMRSKIKELEAEKNIPHTEVKLEVEYNKEFTRRRTIEEKTAASTLIVVGNVVEVTPYNFGDLGENNALSRAEAESRDFSEVYTEAVIEVTETLYGDLPEWARIRIKRIGGEAGNLIVRIGDVTPIRFGDERIFFLTKEEDAAEDEYTLVDPLDGTYLIIAGNVGGDPWDAVTYLADNGINTLEDMKKLIIQALENK